jgi:N-acetylneuraminic acid mutarotase
MRFKNTTIASVLILLSFATVLAACSNTTTVNVRQSQTPPKQIPAAESGIMPWSLEGPLSRAGCIGVSNNSVVIAGGLTPSGYSATGVFVLNTITGKLSLTGYLKLPVHDAGVVEFKNNLLVIGGGSSQITSAVQSAPISDFGSGNYTQFEVIGNLPVPRADLSAIVLNNHLYVIGGYDGTNLSSVILTSADGTSFSSAGKLAVPVRYPALVSYQSDIFIIGGIEQNGTYFDGIQKYDTVSHADIVYSRLPEALAGASAGISDGTIYIGGGANQTGMSNQILALDIASKKILNAGLLNQSEAYASTCGSGSKIWIIGGENNGSLLSSVQYIEANLKFGISGTPGAGSPFYGLKLLIADRGNDRLLLLNDQNQITWSFPSSSAPAPSEGFYFPDDAFFIDKGKAIITNQEEQNTILEIAFPSGKVLWSYGHPNQTGTGTGYLDQPDDAYLLSNGLVSVADALNCRILFINPKTNTVVNQIGTNSKCVHNPPNFVGYPNGDTPLAGSNVLVSEIDGSWISDYSDSGKLNWTTQLPISYPSDPQQIGNNLYLVADYALPGSMVEFNQSGQITYTYKETSGIGELNHPSLGELIPSGVFMINDDYNNRMVAIDPITNAVVWQYGVDGVPGQTPGYLNRPDGFDLLAPNGATPTHPLTG